MDIRGSVREWITHPALIKARESINFDSNEMTNLIWDPEVAKYWKETHEFASVHTLYQNKPEWYNMEWDEKITNMYEKFSEFNKWISSLGIKINTMNMNELIHVV